METSIFELSINTMECVINSLEQRGWSPLCCGSFYGGPCLYPSAKRNIHPHPKVSSFDNDGQERLSLLPTALPSVLGQLEYSRPVKMAPRNSRNSRCPLPPLGHKFPIQQPEKFPRSKSQRQQCLWVTSQRMLSSEHKLLSSAPARRCWNPK